jgi:alkyldihydroxyacetonephosphate synthase
MRRWNGWGDDQTLYPLPESAAAYLAELVGPGQPQPDASLAYVVASVPASRLPAHPMIDTDPAGRLAHARGQSLPDWVALRAGLIDTFPDGVAYPASDEEVRALLAYARRSEARLVPYGGGTSVVGHINPLPGRRPVLTVDLGRLNRLISLDETSQLATLEAGIAGPVLENQLRARGYTLGHFPQSFEYSTLGGWIATRSSGQQSYHYGRIEELFAGGHIETPWVISTCRPCRPARPAPICASFSSARKDGWASSPGPPFVFGRCPNSRTFTPSSSVIGWTGWQPYGPSSRPAFRCPCCA